MGSREKKRKPFATIHYGANKTIEVDGHVHDCHTISPEDFHQLTARLKRRVQGVRKPKRRNGYSNKKETSNNPQGDGRKSLGGNRKQTQAEVC